MPNRYVRASAIESEAVNSLSWQAEVFWRRLLNRVDDFGRFTANANLLRAALFPLQLEKVNTAKVTQLLAECEKAGLVFRYDAAGKQLLVMNKWENGRAKRSDYAEPPANICERMKTYVYTCKHKHAYAPDSDSDSDTDTDAVGKSAAVAAPTSVSDSEWLQSLGQLPTYAGIDVGREHGKMVAWCSANRKQPTRRRFINWLNHAERPMQVGQARPPQRPAIREPQGWKGYLNRTYPESVYSAGGKTEAHEWAQLPSDVQTKLAGEIRRNEEGA